MGWLVPDFSFETDTSLFTAGEPSSLILPALIAATSVVLMFRGVQRQRSGEHLLLSAGLATMQFQDWRILHLFRRIKFACPTTSGDAAFRWQQRQFRGAQVAIGMGASIGILVVVFLQLTSVRGFWDGSVDLDEISGIAFIFFWAVTIGILATVFGASYSNGVARFSTFDRTLPLSTAKMTAMRLQTVVICVLLIGLVELLTIALLGSLILEKFSLVRQEFYQQVLAQLDQGLFYLLMRVILSACLLYVLVVLCAVFITWFAIRSRLMTFLFSALVVYWLLVVAGLVAFTEGQEFVTTAQTVGTIHGWIISAGIIAAAIYLLKYLVDARVLNESQAMILVGVGLSLAVLQLVDLQFFAELNSDGSIDANVLSYSAGLLPLTATVVALWTQFRVRHG